MAAGGEGELRVLDVELRVGKQRERACVIVMEVGQDHVFDRQVIDPGIAQPFDDRPRDDPPARRRGILAETGVDDHRRVAVPMDRPDEVVERHGQVVVVDRRGEIVTRGPLVPGVADGIDAADAGHDG